MPHIDPKQASSSFATSVWTTRLGAGIVSVAISATLLGSVLSLFELRSSEAAIALARARQPVVQAAREAAAPTDADRRRGI